MDNKKLIIGGIILAGVILLGVIISILAPVKTIQGTRNINATTYTKISYETYQNKIANGDDFIVYVYSDYCGACVNFKPHLDEVITAKKLQVFAIDAGALESGQTIPAKVTPSLMLYSKGKIIQNINGGNHDAFKSAKNLSKYFDKRVVMTNAN